MAAGLGQIQLVAVPAIRLLLATPMAGPGAIVGGVLLVLLGQVARALLEQANAMQELAALLRLAGARRRAKTARYGGHDCGFATGRNVTKS